MWRVTVYTFRVVQLHGTALNPLMLFQQRKGLGSKCASSEFGRVRLYRTVANCIFSGGTRCGGYLYTQSGWFNTTELYVHL